MTHINQLSYCLLCQHQQQSPQGVLCGLTHKKPSFENKCPTFLIDEQRALNVKHNVPQLVTKKKSKAYPILSTTAIAFVTIMMVVGIGGAIVWQLILEFFQSIF